MIIVTGTPRCGSSLMMNCLLNLLGESNIVGDKFPTKNRDRKFKIYAKIMTAHGFTIKQTKQKFNKKKADRKKFNPNGFFEDRYVMRGFHYDDRGLDHFNDLANSPNKAIKLLGRGLANTHPDHVDKIIVCLRNPFDIALSQKNLRRPNGKFSPTPDAQINSYQEIIKYLADYPNIPVLVVDYKAHSEDSQAVMDKLALFLDVPTAKSPYKKTISKNSNSEEFDGEDWSKAFELQDLIKKGV